MGSCGADALHCGHLRYLALNDDESMYACYCQESLSPRRILALALTFEYLCWTIGFCFILICNNRFDLWALDLCMCLGPKSYIGPK
jgi:hypothetical protein